MTRNRNRKDKIRRSQQLTGTRHAAAARQEAEREQRSRQIHDLLTEATDAIGTDRSRRYPLDAAPGLDRGMPDRRGHRDPGHLRGHRRQPLAPPPGTAAAGRSGQGDARHPRTARRAQRRQPGRRPR